MVQHAGAKMSKSLGNIVMAQDLLHTCSAGGVRLYLASHHYRQEGEHDDHSLANIALPHVGLQNGHLSL